MDPKLDDIGNRPFPLKYTVGLLIVAILLVIALFGGIRGCELQKQAPVAKTASMRDLAHACAEQTDRELAPTEQRLFGRTFPVHRDPPAPLPLLAVVPLAAVPVVRAKFRLVEKREHCDNQGTTLVFTPVTSGYDDIEEDKRFHRYTPSGKLEMFVNNPPAVEKFALGGKYYLDFTPADVPPGDPANIPGVNHG